MTKHALLSPSGFKALMLCPAKPAMERGLPDQSSEYADEGTAAHELAAMALEDGFDATHYLGTVIDVAGNEFIVDADMADHVQVYIDLVRDITADGDMFIEQSLPIGHITGEEGAEGTGDAVILRGNELIVIDLKFGRGVEVDAEMNPQLMLYGLGALEKFDLVGDIEHVRMVVSQPRVSRAPSEFAMPAAELVQWGMKYAGPAASKAMQIYNGVGIYHDTWQWCDPHEDACRFCKAKSTCSALAEAVKGALNLEFTDLTTEDAIGGEETIKASVAKFDDHELGAKMQAIPLIEMWCKAIRARVEKQLLDGGTVAGFKLVQGKRGARSWTSDTEAEALMKSMRLKKEEMYDFKLISPTSAEKILKKTPKRWARIAPFIEQRDGNPSVAPLSDKRPALELKPIDSEFEAIGGAEDLV